MSEASDSERCEGVAVEEGVVGEAMRHVDKGTGDTGGTPEDDPVGGSGLQHHTSLSLYQPASQIHQLVHLP
jgi:hypothetical protein